MIRLQRIEIQKFGKISGMQCDLSRGVQVLYGVNEAGKSTLQLFLKTMFYGIARRGGRDEVKERERILPWDGGTAGGSLYLEKDGQELVITRTFGKRPASDTIHVFDKKTGEEIPSLMSGNGTCGELLLGIPEEVFVKTLSVRQQDISIRGRNEEMQKRLLTLMSDGVGEVSFLEAKQRLSEEHKRLKAETKREKPGIIDQKNEELRTLRQEIYKEASAQEQRKQQREQQEELKQELDQAEKEYDELTRKQRGADALRLLASKSRVEEWRKRIKEIQDVSEVRHFRDIEPERIETLFKLEKDILALDRSAGIEYDRGEEKANKKRRLLFWVIGSILILASVLFWALGRYWPAGLCLVGGVFGFILAGIWPGTKGDTDEKEPDGRLERQQLIAQRDALLHALEMEDVFAVQTAYSAYLQFIKELDMLTSMIKTELGSRSYEELKRYVEEEAQFVHPQTTAADHYEEQLADQGEQVKRLRRTLLQMEQEAGYEHYQNQDMGMMAGRAAQLEEELAQLNLRYRAVCLAEEKIQAAYQKFQSDFTPILTDKMQPLLKQMTGGRYTDIRVSDDFRIRFCRDGVFHPSESLSRGAYDRIYLALRLALIPILFEKSFLCMDDVLTNLDDQQTVHTAQAITEYTEQEEIQIILFTCHKRDVENFRRLGAVIIEIEGGATDGSRN